MKTPNEKTLAKLIKAPLVNLCSLVDKIASPDALLINRAMENDAERLILVASYLSARANGQDHDGARKQASSKLVKVRRALGYSFPKQGLAEVSY